MPYDLQKTPGGNAYLGPNGTFAQLVEGLKAIALNRDGMDSAIDAKAFKVEGILGTSNLNDIGRGVWTQPYQGNATEDRNYPQAGVTGMLMAVATDPDNQIRQTYFSLSGIWQRVRVAYSWTAWERLTSTMSNRGNLGSKNLDDIADGFHVQPYSSGATTALNYPATTSGWMLVVSSGSVIWQLYSADAGRGLWRRKRGSDFTWGPWERVDSSIRNRGLIGSTHLDQVLEDGTWFQKYSSGATPELGYPVKSAGQLEVRTLYAAGGDRSQTYWPSSSGLGVWRRVASGSSWSAWEQVTSGSVSTPTPGSSAAGSPGTASILAPHVWMLPGSDCWAALAQVVSVQWPCGSMMAMTRHVTRCCRCFVSTRCRVTGRCRRRTWTLPRSRARTCSRGRSMMPLR